MVGKKNLRHSLFMGLLRGIVLFFLATEIVAKPLDIQIETPYAILINAKTGKILYEKHSKESVYPASTTKIATVLYILKVASEKLDDMVICSEEALKSVSEETKKAKGSALPPYILEFDGTSARLKRNEKISVRDLLYGALLASGNDAANVLAEYVCGDISTFVNNVNKMAEELGCKNTHFSNPHGLFHSEHTTCAYDMAILTKEALKYPVFREIIKTDTYERSHNKVFTQGNGLVRRDHKFYYPLALGVKTGYIRKAKYNLVAAASNGEREVIAVLHKSPSGKRRYQDAIVMFEAAFCEVQVQRLLFAKEETVFKKMVPKAKNALLGVVEKDLYLSYYPSEEEEVEAKLDWEESILPIEAGSVIGKLSVFTKADGRVLLEAPLIAKERVCKKFVYVLLEDMKAKIVFILLPLLLGVGVGGFVLVKRGRGRQDLVT